MESGWSPGWTPPDRTPRRAGRTRTNTDGSSRSHRKRRSAEHQSRRANIGHGGLGQQPQGCDIDCTSGVSSPLDRRTKTPESGKSVGLHAKRSGFPVGADGNSFGVSTNPATRTCVTQSQRHPSCSHTIMLFVHRLDQHNVGFQPPYFIGPTIVR